MQSDPNVPQTVQRWENPTRSKDPRRPFFDHPPPKNVASISKSMSGPSARSSQETVEQWAGLVIVAQNVPTNANQQGVEPQITSSDTLSAPPSSPTPPRSPSRYTVSLNSDIPAPEWILESGRRRLHCPNCARPYSKISLFADHYREVHIKGADKWWCPVPRCPKNYMEVIRRVGKKSSRFGIM